jgi:hypothetical protein
MNKGKKSGSAFRRALSRFTVGKQRQVEPSRSRAIVTWLTGGRTRTRRARRRR